MAEYINRDLVYRAVADVMSYNDVPLQRYDSLLDVVGSIPPVDVRPVRRGRWVDEHVYKQTMSGKIYDGFTYCSNCKQDFSFGYRSKFCPNCGADMRGGDAE